MDAPLRPRYGENAILIVSQFITKDLMQERGSLFEFLDKGSVASPRLFVRGLCDRLREMRKKQSVFVAMPFDQSYYDLYETGIITPATKLLTT